MKSVPELIKTVCVPPDAIKNFSEPTPPPKPPPPPTPTPEQELAKLNKKISDIILKLHPLLEKPKIPTTDGKKFMRRNRIFPVALLAYLKSKRIPKGLDSEEEAQYKFLISISDRIVIHNETLVVEQLPLVKAPPPTPKAPPLVKASASKDEAVKNYLLDCDRKRVNLTPYPPRILSDVNAGHWELYEQLKNPPKDAQAVELEHPLPARPPQLDIRPSGIVAIDFGTKSTVVVCRERDERLLRVGKGDYSGAPVQADYENPTVIELRDVVAFRQAYAAREGRPFTEWNQLKVSHEAAARLLEDDACSIYPSVFGELKQWALASNDSRRLRDQNGADLVLPPYDSLSEDDFDPIEVYAYYLGSYINNMINGIWLEYILSFPVGCERAARQRLLSSFTRGLKKSLPPSLLNDEETMEDFRVFDGASEPAAYASCALKELGKSDESLRPTTEHPICYGVFDFGGGTTDFDFGIWRLPSDDERGTWNFILEHFGAGSDDRLGGEKLLQLMAYEVFRDNVELMRSNKISFALPDECPAFGGSELLLTKSDAAYLNRRRLSELLRPIWEEAPEHEKLSTPQTVTMFRDTDTCKVELKIDTARLKELLETRIRRGIENFFVSLEKAFEGRDAPLVHVLLAGNSCKSSLVRKIFEDELKLRAEKLKIQLHPPLNEQPSEPGEPRSALEYDRMPTGKTGVAFGLLDCRRGGHDVQVIDHNLSAAREAPFKYYIGCSDREDCFRVLIDRNVGYNVWAPLYFVDDDRFELYYTSEPRALTSRLPLGELPAPKKCRIRYRDDNSEGTIYVRKVAPNRIEYVVAEESGLEREQYLSEVGTCRFN